MRIKTISRQGKRVIEMLACSFLSSSYYVISGQAFPAIFLLKSSNSILKYIDLTNTALH